MSNRRTIAVVSAGEMGSAVGRVLRQGGARVVTWVEGRSAATQQRAEAAGMQRLPDLDSLVREADLVVGIVPPLAAAPLASEVAAAAVRTGAALLYCDANSIGPGAARLIDTTVASAGGRFVDGAIIGGAAGWERGRTTLYLSGRWAPEVAELLEPLRTQALGAQVGQASALKVLYAGLTKGLSALGMELLAGAQRLGILDLLLDRYRTDQPEVARFFASTLPGLPPRAGRRAEEMLELADTLEALDLDARMARAAQAVLAAVAERQQETPAADSAPLEELVRWWTH